MSYVGLMVERRSDGTPGEVTAYRPGWLRIKERRIWHGWVTEKRFLKAWAVMKLQPLQGELTGVSCSPPAP